MSDIPKEQQSAYQRWEMNSFGDERPSVVAKRPIPVDLPTEESVQAIRDEARVQGYDTGRQAGWDAGHAEGLALGRAEAAIELEHLCTIATTFGSALAEADQLIAHEVMELALQLAKGMLKNALEVKPELLLPIVREAIEYLPALQQPALLMLNPADAQIVREGIGEELDKGGWRIVEDSQIGRGGCKIDTATNQIDAQASSRWLRLTAALGKNLDWLAP